MDRPGWEIFYGVFVRKVVDLSGDRGREGVSRELGIYDIIGGESRW